MNSIGFLFEDKVEWQELGEGVRRQVLGYDEKLMTVKVEFQSGSIGTLHSHVHSQTTYVASGVFEFEINSVKQIVKSGDGLYIAPETVHGVVCLESGILIDSFSPVRADFLK